MCFVLSEETFQLKIYQNVARSPQAGGGREGNMGNAHDRRNSNANVAQWAWALILGLHASSHSLPCHPAPLSFPPKGYVLLLLQMVCWRRSAGNPNPKTLIRGITYIYGRQSCDLRAMEPGILALNYRYFKSVCVYIYIYIGIYIGIYIYIYIRIQYCVMIHYVQYSTA